MTTTAIVSIICPDRVGLISAITGRLFDLGADLGDTSFSVLNAKADFNAVCVFPNTMDLDTLKGELADLPETAGANIEVEHMDTTPALAPSPSITHAITVSGGDCPGLMTRLCEVFQLSNANIVHMKSERVQGGDKNQYVISAFVTIPAANEQICLTTVTNTAGELGLTCQWEKLVSP